MILKEVQLQNWQPFEGDHVLKLEGIVYSVLACRDRDPEASNYSGKSSLFEAIRFALFGTHRHQPGADGWITEGQKEGRVALRFDDGTVVQRSRKPGQSTQFEVTGPGGKTSKQDEAQALLLQRVGMTEEDLMACSYLEQGSTARFVTEDPGPRTAMVVGWLRLEPVQRAWKAAGEELAAVDRKVAAATAKRDAVRERLVAAAGGMPQVEATLDQYAEEKAHLEREVAEWDAKLVVAQERAKGAEEAAADRLRREELARVVDEGRRLAKEQAGTDGAAIVARAEQLAAADIETKERVTEARAKVASRRSVATGTFDGRCPVAGIVCPATAQINDMAGHGKAELDAAQRELDVAEGAATVARRDVGQMQGELAEHSRRRDRLVELSARAKRLKEELGSRSETRVSDSEEMSLEDVTARCYRTRATLRELEATIGQMSKDVDEVRNREYEIGLLEKEAATLREAQAILGRSGAQRRLAEGALSSIEGEANHILEDCGVGLSLALRWERDGRSIADECDRCGKAFAASTREKACTECAAPRGKNRIQQLDVLLSRESGAAKDLGGLAVALGAAKWLREARDSSWAVAMLDEVGSALDKKNRRALGGQLRQMLAASGFLQAFVVGHDAQSLSTLPGRILVTSDGRRSRVEVG